MANTLRNWVDRFMGRGDAAVTVPPLDGALKPNNLLEEAGYGLAVKAPDNLALVQDHLFYSSGNKLYRKPVGEGLAEIIHEASAPISAIAVSSEGILAVAAGKTIRFLSVGGAERPGFSQGEKDWSGITAMDFSPNGTLVVAIGSSKNAADDWQRDLLDDEKAGSVWRLDVKTGQATQLAERLRYPNGLVVELDGGVIVSEAWAKRLIRLNATGGIAGGSRGQVMEDLPGYPARIARSKRGGYWLSVFAPRSQLIEFVLREPVYRKAMMRDVDKEFWIAPALRSGYSFREPMQGGALKQMGVLKPWAPTRSYGLVIELTPDFTPLRSFHSRAGGKRHGVTSAVEANGHLWATSKGGDELVAISLDAERK
ncbi:strictosidine synthase [Ochrobactrum sp. Q0168]|uniref:strictosidine synthase n=1 Tax=Ochrobactrum sp. Q0168 TaxID=2793241 RepID=UPI0018EAAB67|nr:strictosidine synthase [Ochrobactrum sp. Q0168]